MSFRRSLRFAFRGIRYVYRHERNFRIHTGFTVAALALATALGISSTQWLFVITAIVSVLALEIVNTMFERVVDMFQPRVHEYAGAVKDLMAAVVLLASGSALIVGIIIFLPLLISRLR